jgi:hypothetical protein
MNRLKNLKFPIKGRKQWAFFIILMLLLTGSLIVILRVETEYHVLSSDKKTDVSGTSYRHFGRKWIKCSPDGVSCLNPGGEVSWNSTFSMQSPMLDICDRTAVAAEQQGTQIYVYGQDGQIGQFETLLPIQRACVSRQGVVAAVLEDEEVTWINLYDTSGNEIAKIRTTLKESGYPMDMAISDDGSRLIVSFLYADEGEIRTYISVYDFGMANMTEEKNLVSRTAYTGVVSPEIFFTDEKHAAAIFNDGFAVYQGADLSREKTRVTFEEEILSTFHEGGNIGFIFKSSSEEYPYKMQIYNLNGRCIMKKQFRMDYQKAKMEGGNVILYNDKGFEVYSSHGRKRASIKYQRPVEDVTVASSLGQYLVVSSEYTEMIRVY